MSGPELVSHYELLELVGRDGETETYRARDLRLRRIVAVRLLRDGHSSPASAERFRREAHIASLVTHPHVCAVHDAGEDGGRAFLVTELLDGQLLARVIDGTPLPVERLLDVGIQLTGALLAAHRRGLVHGNVSPETVFITTDGHVKLLGLGTARLDPVGAAGSSGFNTTAADVAIVADAPVSSALHPYMSPEQVAGHPATQASDIFASGTVLHEMATGQPPFQGASPADLALAILHGVPAPTRTRRRKVPAALGHVIERALAKDPRERHPSAEDLLDDLRHVRRVVDRDAATALRWPARRTLALTAAVAAAVLAGIGAAGWWRGAAMGSAATAGARNAVLISHIANGTADPDFDGTLRQAATVYLGQSPYLDLVSDERIAAVLQQMGRPAGLAVTHQAATELCVRVGSQALLEGSVSAIGGSTVIALVATDCGNGATITREQAEVQRKEDVLRVLGELTASIRTALGESRASLTAHNVRLEDATTPSLEALKAYTEAAARRASGREAEGIRWLERAIEADPKFALAYATLSTAYGGLGESGRSEEYARRAYALSNQVSERERLFILSQYHDRVTGDQLKAREALEVWKSTYPRDYRPANALAVLLNRLGDFAAAAAEAEEAIRRNPAHAFPYSNLAHARRGQGRYAEARRTAEAALAQQLETAPMRRLMYQIAELEGDRAAAQAQIDWAGSRLRGFDLTGARAQVAAFHGRMAEARTLFEATVTAAEQQGYPQIVSGYNSWSAVTNALKGQRDRALSQARRVLNSSTAPEPRLRAALALALAGSPGEAELVVQALGGTRREDTQLHGVYLPIARAGVLLAQGRFQAAVEALRPTAPYEYGLLAALAPAYLRGEAHRQGGAHAEAARAFRLVIEHRGTDPFSPFIPAAHLGLARALAAAGQPDESRKAYDTLLDTMWVRADADLPVVREARAEAGRP